MRAVGGRGLALAAALAGLGSAGPAHARPAGVLAADGRAGQSPGEPTDAAEQELRSEPPAVIDPPQADDALVEEPAPSEAPDAAVADPAADDEASSPRPSGPPDATPQQAPPGPGPAESSDYDPSTGAPPGGYFSGGVLVERPPPDGERRILIGSILVPLGALATISSAVGVWLTVPEHCARRLAPLGLQIDDPSRCNGVFIFNITRTTYGALMLMSGATILGIGLVERQRYRQWRRRHGMKAELRPVLAPPLGGPAQVGLRLRF